VKRCPHCRSPMDPTPRALPPLSGEHGSLRLTIEELPAVVCPNGHHAPVDPDFMYWLIQELKERAGKVPGGQDKGLFLKKYVCTCGSILDARSDHRETVRERIAYEDRLRFDAFFEFAMHKCPGCGKSQLRSGKEAQRDVAHSLAGITDAARFPHSG